MCAVLLFLALAACNEAPLPIRHGVCTIHYEGGYATVAECTYRNSEWLCSWEDSKWECTQGKITNPPQAEK